MSPFFIPFNNLFSAVLWCYSDITSKRSKVPHTETVMLKVLLNKPYNVFTLAVSGTGTGIRTGTDIVQKPFTLAVSGARTGHLKAIEISLKHIT